MSTTIRVNERTRDRLAALAKSEGKPMIAVVDEALDALERRVFFNAFDTRYGVLRDDASAWAEIESERATEEKAIQDASA